MVIDKKQEYYIETYKNTILEFKYPRTREYMTGAISKKGRRRRQHISLKKHATCEKLPAKEMGDRNVAGVIFSMFLFSIDADICNSRPSKNDRTDADEKIFLPIY